MSRMLQLRSTTSIFKLVLALSIGVVVFIIIQMSYLPGAEKGSQEVLEQRLIHLEGDLSRSRRVVGQLHDAIERLMTSPPAGGGPADGGEQPVPPPPPPPAAQSRVPADAGALCKFGSQPPSKTDVQMLDVYRDIPFDNPDGGVWKQGWQISYDAGQWSQRNKLKVFVVPHSHNDPGWIKTFEQYYTAQTRHIFDSMVNMLEKYPRMKFIWAEISYLDLWWREVSPEVKARVKRLVSRGQLELVTAGWVMHDEANSHYMAILEQLTTGHEWLRLNLNATISNGWAIDPFGLSPTTAYMLRRSGLDHMIIQRAHYVIKRHLARQKQLEFWWRQTWDSGDTTDMFCHLMPFYSYDTPHTCGPNPKVCCQFDFARLPGGRYSCPWKVAPVKITEANVAKRALTLLDQYRKKAQLYASNVLMVPLGDDFRYDAEHEWEAQYTNYQKLFDHMNSQTGWHVEAQFGTLSDYFSALEAESKQQSGGAAARLASFPRLSGDFFTYADKNDEYWSGYFTTRPFHKQMDRVLIGQLRSAEILYSLALSAVGGQPSSSLRQHLSQLMADLVTARRALSLFQHHDGVTGTAKDRVVIDYGNKLFAALERSGRVQQQAVQLLLLPSLAGWQPDLSAHYWLPAERRPSPERLPERPVLQLSPDSSRQVALFNSLAHRRTETVTLHVSAAHVQVTAADGRVVSSQCDPVFDAVGGRRLAGTHRLTFMAELAPLTVSVFMVREAARGENKHHSLSEVTLMLPGSGPRRPPPDSQPYSVTVAEPETITLNSESVQLQFIPDGLLRLVKPAGRDAVPLVIQFVTYGVARGGDMSGAYIFRPDGQARPYRRSGPVRVVRGPLVSEVTVQLPEVEHTVRLVTEGDNAGWLEIQNRADVSGQRNFELVMRLSSGIESGNRVVTDLNGFQTIERRTLEKLPIQGNYYPVPSMMYIEDSRARLTLALGQPLGGASLAPGQMEVMLDRRLMQDDNRGVGQGVTDTRLTLSTFRLLLEFPDSEAVPVKPLPSLLAHSARRSLLHPVTALLEGPDLPSDARPRGAAPPSRRLHWSPGGGTPAACDLELTGLRSGLAGGDGGDQFWPGKEVTLTVRRVGADCRFPGPLGDSCTAAGKFSVSQLLPKGFQTGVQQVSLTGVHPGRRLSLSTPLALDPMELYAFRLNLV